LFLALEKCVFGLDPDHDWGLIQGSGSVKNESRSAALSSVSDQDSFFMDLDPGIFFQSRSRPEHIFLKPKTNIGQHFWFQPKKKAFYLCFLPIKKVLSFLLNRELLFGIIFFK